jgi:uncharacterized RDD family membrane protein YckC
MDVQLLPPPPEAQRPLAGPAAYAWKRHAPATASATRRAVAFGLDSLIVFVLAWSLAFVLSAVGLLHIPDIDLAGQKSPVLGLLWLVSILEGVMGPLYFTLFEAQWARTPGKMVAGLRVARLDGSHPSLFESFLRNLLRLLWVTPFFVVFIAVDLWSLRTTELDQRLGDLAAGTVVIDERASATMTG